MRAACLILCLLLVTGCVPGVDEAAFIERLGTDTLAVEVYQRTPERLEGRIVTRQPMTRVISYRADLAEGRIHRLWMRAETPATNPGGPGPQVATVTMDGDSVVTELVRETADTAVAPRPDDAVLVLPRTPLPAAFVEHLVRLAREAGGDEVAFNLVAPGGRVRPNTVTFLAADTATLDFFGDPMFVTMDGDAVRHISGRATTMKIETERVPPAAVDVAALAEAFAARDARGEGIGVASPRDTVELGYGGATFALEYSRPAKRGREIWGGLVPYGQVWRTGANAATHFTTSRPVRIGDARLDAGSYTLWSRFTPDGGVLILNGETGIWGTQHDPAHDLATVPLERRTLSEPVERFTMALEPAADGAVLELRWDTTAWSVPIAVAAR